MFGDTSVKIDRTLSTLIFYNKVLTGQLETHNQHLSAMKKLLLILVAGILFSPQIDADTILMRDGTEMNVSVQQLSDTKVMYRLNKKDDVKTLPTRDVYMIKFDKRGNVYITPEGKRVTGETYRYRAMPILYILWMEESFRPIILMLRKMWSHSF